MPVAVHFRRGKDSIVLQHEPTTELGAVLAELAEVLVETKMVTHADTATLRLAVEAEQPQKSWTDITEQRSKTLGDLKISDGSIIAFALNGESFSYEPYPTFDD